MKDTTFKNLPKLAMALLLAGALALTFSLSLGAKQAWAGGFEKLEDVFMKSSYYTPYLGKKADSGVRLYATTKKISNTKSSNKKVATVKSYKYKSGGKTRYALDITLKKAGTTKISFKLNGKKRTVKFIAKKYMNPVKSFKVGSKEYKSAFNAKNVSHHFANHYSTAVKSNPFKGKLNVSCAKGWKLAGVYANGTKKVKNKSNVKATDYLRVDFKHKSTGTIVEYDLLALSAEDYTDYLEFARAA